MSLKSQVVFEEYTNSFYNRVMVDTKFNNIEELKEKVKDVCRKDLPTELTVSRSVYIIDTDKDSFPISPFNQPQELIKTQKISFTVTNKLWYPKDVLKFLNKTYNESFGFEKKGFDKKTPVIFDGSNLVYPEERTGMCRPDGTPTSYSWKELYCRQATQNDIIVDHDLNQIWPKKTNKPPKLLLDLLAKTKEVIR